MTNVSPTPAQHTEPMRSEPEQHKPVWRRLPGIRLQLTLWYTAMFAGVLLLAVGVSYGALKLTLDWQVDASLQTQAQRIAAGISDQHGTVVIRNVTGLLPGLPVAGTTPPAQGSLDDGTLVRVLSPSATVLDTGVGVPAADLPHVFERFYRADSARRHEQGGSGLGLAIAQTLVQAHGGAITVSSAVGVGSRFVVTLPLSSRQPHRPEKS
jgi:Histidine kinase-, DNA gyrase B-, and HSP90-like ATPase